MPKCSEDPQVEMEKLVEVPAIYGGAEYKQQMFKCPKCGLLLTYVFPKEEEEPKKCGEE